MPESSTRLVFPLAAEFLRVPLDSIRFYLRQYRISRNRSEAVRRVFERALSRAPAQGEFSLPAARLDLRASRSTLRVTLRVPTGSLALAALRSLLRKSPSDVAASSRSKGNSATLVVEVPIPENR